MDNDREWNIAVILMFLSLLGFVSGIFVSIATDYAEPVKPKCVCEEGK